MNPQLLLAHHGEDAVQTASPLIDTVFNVGRGALVAVVCLGTLIAIAHVRAEWRSDGAIDDPVGVMIAMSADLAHGIFYRPLLGPEGYGGTRYFPLYFVLHASLVRMHLPILAAAYLLSAIAMLALMLGVFCLLRRSGVERWVAAACAGILLISVSGQYAVVSPHADALASGLSVWALVVVLDPKLNSRRVLLATVLFVLSWSAKVTSVFGFAAAVVWLATVGRRRRALQLAFGTIVGYVAVAAAMILGSDGRVLRIFRLCASGGMTWKQLATGPLVLESNALRNDIIVLLLICFALTPLLGDLLEAPGRCITNLPSLFFILTLLVTSAIFSSPGTGPNHLLDIEVAAVFFLGCLTVRPSRMQRRLGVYALALASVIPVGRSATAIVSKTFERPVPSRSGSDLQSVVRLLGQVDKPILSENPALPVLMGHAPYVLDPWMFRVLRGRIPGFEKQLFQRLRNRAFGAVVLFFDPETEQGREWYEKQKFGPGFATILKENYQFFAVTHDEFVYVPITSPKPDKRGR